MMRIFSAEGNGSPLQEVVDLVHPEGRWHERDFASDEPGTGFDRVGQGQHAMGQQVSPKREEAQRFALAAYTAIALMGGWRLGLGADGLDHRGRQVDADIGGLKVVTQNGWFAARPSGTENIYKIYAESFRGEQHLDAIINEAQQIVGDALRADGS